MHQRLRIGLAAAAIGVGSAGCTATRPPPVAPPPAPAPIEVPAIARPAGETPEWWFRAGAAAAVEARGGTAGRARNLIVFLGDGMSLATIASARILEGQRRGASGEENRLSFETFPYTALSRTYETNQQTPDSAGTMSAIMTGVKTRAGVISVNQRTPRGDCAAMHGNEALTLLELAQAAGLATGVVTTARVTHATPAATYGHSPDRHWEHDGAVPASARAQGCVDLARQLVESATPVDLVLGGGRARFLPATQADPEYPQRNGLREDGRDLTAEWLRRPGAVYVWNADQLAAIDPASSGPILGLFEPGHMNYQHDRPADAGGEPDLAAMTRLAIERLAGRPEGYFLMVESGRIDHAHHAGNAFRALDETVALSDAVRVALEVAGTADTLILVTADHAHTLSFAGYPVRGNPILGLVHGVSDEDQNDPAPAVDLLGRPYTTLSYANGPGYAGASASQAAGSKRFPHLSRRAEPALGRPDLSGVDTEAPDYLQEALLPLASESHSGEDVAVFAIGPGAEAVRGSLEQNVLFHLLAQANAPILRTLCAIGSCDRNGVPVLLPDRARLLDARR